MKRVLVFFLLMSILILPGVIAAPPFQEAAAATGLDVRFPPLMTFAANSTVTGHTHVYNRSTGLPVTNETTQCFLHLYNETGSHLVEQEMEFSSNGQEWQQIILGGNLSEPGERSFIIWCNASLQGGFVSGAIDITESGDLLSEAGSKFYIGVIFFFLLISIMLFIGFYKEGKWQMKMTYALFSYVFFLIALNIIDLTVKSLVVNPSLLTFFDSILAVSFIILWFFVVMVGVIWIITLFQTLLLRQAKLKIDKFH